MWAKINHIKRARNTFMNSFSTITNYNLFSLPKMSFGVKRWRHIDPDVLAERREYYRQVSEYRKRHKEEYERVQAEADHRYYNPDSEGPTEEVKIMINQMRKNLTKERTSIIKIAMHTKNQIMHLEKKEIEQEEKDKWKRIRDMQKLRERQMYLQALQIDSSAPIPSPTIVDFTQYYERLQNLAMLTVHGNYDEAEKLLKNQETVEEKNIYLQPLYRSLKQ